MSAKHTNRRPDPAGRREGILRAAIEVIAEGGIAHASHRAIADRAGVPLGSTTYYFPTLESLRGEALERASDELRDQLTYWKDELDDSTDPAETLTRLTHEYLADRPRALLEYELFLAAARIPQLRPAALNWITGVRRFLSPFAGEDGAMAIAALLDGFLVEAIATGEPPPRDRMYAAIARHLESDRS